MNYTNQVYDPNNPALRHTEHLVADTVSEFLPKLKGLDAYRLALYALACCERAIPTYTKFSIKYKVGDSKAVRQLLDQSWNSVNTIDIGLDFKYVDSVLDSADFNPEDWSILLASHAATALDVIDQLLKSQSNSRLESVEVGLSFFFNDLASFLIESGLEVGMLLEDITPTIASSELWTSEVAIHTEMIVIVIDESVDDKVCKANLQAFSQSRLHILE